ncbi:MAG: hypothetical protein KAT62_00120 [Desulfuromonadales bacterium]|nr:hypothetical protein [Desulfuromonadales bacterium]
MIAGSYHSSGFFVAGAQARIQVRYPWIDYKYMTDLNLDSSARLIHEAIQQLGWSADPPSIVDRVKRLDIGLPAEDEFISILSWLGKCSLVHKLDQGQSPLESRETFQVPDLLATFVTKSGTKTALIEVKNTSKKKIIWKPDYLEKLNNYSSLVDLPLLVAWKFNGLWILTDINCFSKARVNHHLSLEEAMKNNLMSYLAGDFIFVMKANVGLHVVLKKMCLISQKETGNKSREEKWSLKIEKAFFTNSDGHEVKKLPTGLWPLFISANPEATDKVEKDRIYQSFAIPENQGMISAHAALPVLINFSMKNNDKIHWRKQLRSHEYPVKISVLYEAAQEGIQQGYVKNIFHLVPATIPVFLKDLEDSELNRNRTSRHFPVSNIVT